MMSMATAMVGNSSSGIVEAASFKLPIVNIGTRQNGRLRSRNVVDCGYSARERCRNEQSARSRLSGFTAGSDKSLRQRRRKRSRTQTAKGCLLGRQTYSQALRRASS